MRQCHFCERWFTNKQAVRAHLKHCPEYQAHLKEQEEIDDEYDDDEEEEDEWVDPYAHIFPDW